MNIHGLDAVRVWSIRSASKQLQLARKVGSKENVEFLLRDLGILPQQLEPVKLLDEVGRPVNHLILNHLLKKYSGRQKLIIVLAQLHQLPSGSVCLHVNDLQGSRYWIPFNKVTFTHSQTDIVKALKSLQIYIDKKIVVFPHGELVGTLREVKDINKISFCMIAYSPVIKLSDRTVNRAIATPHLRLLESESIHIIREAIAEAENPAMLYSIGKDSSVMLHLARKAFYPASPPFPLLHIDTRWKFQEMYLFRDRMADVSGMKLLVHINPEAITKDINPFDHGSALHTNLTKTEGLKQALNEHKFDMIFGGARRDEEKSRAKERIFSFRNPNHHWDPKRQRPELWSLYNTRKNVGESIRVFPLSNWTELDIWQYIYQEDIPVVPLYFAKKRPVVLRDGMIIMIDDSRFRLLPDEAVLEKVVRFRTLGCYPLTGAIESNATDLQQIILELFHARNSERQGRVIDSDASSSMENKKQEGYF